MDETTATRRLEALLGDEGAGWPGRVHGDRVEIAGGDPVLATHFRIGEAAATAIAGCGIVVSDLWEERTGRRQRVRIDVAAAATSLLSFALQRLEGPRASDPAAGRSSVTDFYRARDRWFLLHGSFPKSQAAALELLGCSADSPDKGEVARAIATWDAHALEDAIAERGLCGAVVRSADEWRAHAQGKALAARPVVEVLRVGESDPEPLPRGPRPLSGVRVLDLTRVLAGPTCGRALAEHGADVLRIGSPQLPSIPFFVMDTSHGKRSAHLDLEREADADRLRELVRGAHVFTQGYRLGALERRGFGPEAMHALRPGLVYTSISCYGHEGPWRGRPGWEQIAQTVTGIAAEQGGADGPKLLPAAATDYTTGTLAALGTLVALSRRAREGGSYCVRVSLSRTGMWIDSLGRSETTGAGLDRERTKQWLETTDTPFGRLTHLAPVLELSETKPHWALPTVPLGSHEPVWEDPAVRAEATD